MSDKNDEPIRSDTFHMFILCSAVSFVATRTRNNLNALTIGSRLQIVAYYVRIKFNRKLINIEGLKRNTIDEDQARVAKKKNRG